MKSINTFFLILISILYSSGQSNLDSLRIIWHDNTQHDTQRLEALKTLTWDGYLFTDPDSAFHYSQILLEDARKNSSTYYQIKALNMQGISFMLRGDYHNAISYYEQSQLLSERTNYYIGVANALENIGTCHRKLGDYSRAFSFSNQSLKIAEKLNDNRSIAQSLNNIGLILKLQGNMYEAVDYYLKSLKIKEALNDKLGMANSLNNIGNIYNNQNNFDTALEYYLQSLSIKEEIGYKNGIAQTLNNIGSLYFSKDEYLKAEDFFIRSLKVREELNDPSGVASSVSNLGVLYDHRKNHKLAEEYHVRGLTIRKQIEDKFGISESMLNIGESHALINEHIQSTRWCKNSFELAQEIGSLEIQKLSCECLYISYKSLGKANQALFYFEKSKELEDSLKAEETNLKLQQLEFQKAKLQDSVVTAEEARLVEEAHQDEVRKKNQSRNMLAGGGLILLILAGGLYSRVRYIRKSKSVLQIEKDRSENLLLNILPKEIAQELKEKGRADARNYDLVSILFTDFKGFTEQSAKLSAADLVNEINHCFEAFDNIIEKHKVEKIKTIGDAYMAAGGLPVPTDDSIKNTILAALEMQAFVTKRKVEMDAKDLPAFEMRVGVHSGPVVAGIVGVKKFQYDIWGDTVNTASRMESNGEVGKVNISQATYELLNNDAEFSFENRGRIEAKGKGEIGMYFVSKNE